MTARQNDHTYQRWLYRQRWEHEQAVVAQPRQGVLPFVDADSYLADETPEYHGTNVGLGRHVVAGETSCGPAAARRADRGRPGMRKGAVNTKDWIP